MTEHELDKKVKLIANQNGKGMILEKLKEEAKELLEGLEKNDDENIIEEVADIMLLVLQLMVIEEDNTEKIQIELERKVNRTLLRMGIKEEM